MMLRSGTRVGLLLLLISFLRGVGCCECLRNVISFFLGLLLNLLQPETTMYVNMITTASTTQTPTAEPGPKWSNLSKYLQLISRQ